MDRPDRRARVGPMCLNSRLQAMQPTALRPLHPACHSNATEPVDVGATSASGVSASGSAPPDADAETPYRPGAEAVSASRMLALQSPRGARRFDATPESKANHASLNADAADDAAYQAERNELFVLVGEFSKVPKRPNDIYGTPARLAAPDPNGRARDAADALSKAVFRMEGVVQNLVEGFAKGRRAGLHRFFGNEVYGAQAAVRELRRGIESPEYDGAVSAMRSALVKQYPKHPHEREMEFDSKLDGMLAQCVGRLSAKQREKFIHHAMKDGHLSAATASQQGPQAVGPDAEIMLRKIQDLARAMTVKEA